MHGPSRRWKSELGILQMRPFLSAITATAPLSRSKYAASFLLFRAASLSRVAAAVLRVRVRPPSSLKEQGLRPKTEAEGVLCRFSSFFCARAVVLIFVLFGQRKKKELYSRRDSNSRAFDAVDSLRIQQRIGYLNCRGKLTAPSMVAQPLGHSCSNLFVIEIFYWRYSCLHAILEFALFLSRHSDCRMYSQNFEIFFLPESR